MGKVLPGERAGHWAKAFMTLWPAWLFVFGALGYTNSDEIKTWWAGEHIEEPDGRTEVTEGGITFEQSVVKFSNEVRIELEQLKQDIIQLKARSNRKDVGLQAQIHKWHGDE
jgi:hypothetical protein